MGSDATAHLVFGIKIDPEWYHEYLKKKGIELGLIEIDESAAERNEELEEWGDCDDFDDESDEEPPEWEEIYAAAKADIKQPSGQYDRDAYGKYLEDRRKLLNECGIEISQIGCCYDSVGETETFIAIKEIISPDYDATEISMDELQIDISSWDKLRDFCQTMELPYSPPKWYLIASYG